MKVKDGEHSILATFSNSKNANEAMEALKNAGISNVTLAKMERFNVGAFSQAVMEEDGNLQDTIKSAEKVLLASDPSLSDVGLGKEEVEAFNLNIATSTSKLNQALKIVQKHGGKI